MVTVTNTLVDSADDPAVGAVEVYLVAGDPDGAWDASGHKTVLASWREVLDTTGTWSVTLDPNENLDPADSYYVVVERVEGAGGARPVVAEYPIVVTTSPSTQYAREIMVEDPDTPGGGGGLVTVDLGGLSGTNGDFVLHNGTAFVAGDSVSAAKSDPILDLRQTGSGQTAFLKAAGSSTHAVTVYNAGPADVPFAGGGANAALNVISNNTGDSAMHVRGYPIARGLLKLSAEYPGVSNTSAAAVSIDLRGGDVGTAVQGIFLTATDGPTTGAPIVVRNNAGVEDFTLEGSGKAGFGIPVGDTPQGHLEVAQTSTSEKGIVVQGIAGSTQALLEVREPASGGPHAANLILARNNGRDDFVVKGFATATRVGIGMTTGDLPAAALEVVQREAGAKALSLHANNAASTAIFEIRAPDGAPVAAGANLVQIRVNGREDLKLTVDGLLGIGNATGGDPAATLDVRANQTTKPVLHVRAATSSTQDIAQLKKADGTTTVWAPVAGGLVVGDSGGAAVAQAATDGFLYVPKMAGAPSGVPTAQGGSVAVVFNTTGNTLHVYDGGWLATAALT